MASGTGARSSGRVPVADGLELVYERRGPGPRTVVLPAASWMARDMDPLGPECELVLYDVRGRGRSSAVLDETLLGLERDVEDLERLRSALGLERFSLVGWSYYGALAARYARAHAEHVEALALLAPTAPRRSPFFERFLDNFAKRVSPASLQHLEELRRAGTKATDPLAWCRAVHRTFFAAYVVNPEHLARMQSEPCVAPNLDPDRVNDQGRRVVEKLGDYDWTADFADLDVRTLILHGREDPVDIRGSELWASMLPNARLITLKGVGHMPWLEAPDVFFGALSTFLAGAWPVRDPE